MYIGMHMYHYFMLYYYKIFENVIFILYAILNISYKYIIMLNVYNKIHNIFSITNFLCVLLKLILNYKKLQCVLYLSKIINLILYYLHLIYYFYIE